MFATLKNKIKEETGNEVPTLPVRTSQNRYQRGTLDSTSSVSIESLSMFEQVRVLSDVSVILAEKQLIVLYRSIERSGALCTSNATQ